MKPLSDGLVGHQIFFQGIGKISWLPFVESAGQLSIYFWKWCKNIINYNLAHGQLGKIKSEKGVKKKKTLAN